MVYSGIFDEDLIKEVFNDNYSLENTEGYVVRLADSFNYVNFHQSMAKFVRKNHIKDTHHNWRTNWDSTKINSLDQ